METEEAFNGFDAPEGFPRDTSLEFMAAFYAKLRLLTPEQRLKRMFTLNARCESIARQAVRHAHPEFNEE